jgi:AmiR/NasT family two-component response regulator
MSVTNKFNLRGRRAVVLNPPDADLQELCGQLHRIGLSISYVSPRIATPLRSQDFLFIALSDDTELPAVAEAKSVFGQAVRVVIVENESPTVLERIIAFDADAVIVKPFRPTGLLATLVHALHKRATEGELMKTVERLERKLSGVRDVEKAKEIICGRHEMSPQEAYALIRQNAMNRRTTIEEVATTIVEADRLVSVDIRRPATTVISRAVCRNGS